MMVWAVRGDTTMSPRETWPGLQGCEAGRPPLSSRSPAPVLSGYSRSPPTPRLPGGNEAKWIFKALLSLPAYRPESQQS